MSANQFGIVSGDDGGGGGGSTSFTVYLIGTDWVRLGTATRGVYYVLVKSLIAGGPCLSFSLSRAAETDPISPGPAFSSPASDGTKIGFAWWSTDSVVISKSTTAYDGGYKVTLVGG
jgi:hypothetical protein